MVVVVVVVDVVVVVVVVDYTMLSEPEKTILGHVQDNTCNQ